MHLLFTLLPAHASYFIRRKENILKACKQILNKNNQMTKETENGHDFFLTQGRCSQATERNNVSIFSNRDNSI